MTTTLTFEINTLGYPKAALLTFCLALFAYNAVSLIKAALRREHGRKKVYDEVSGYDLSLEISQTYDGMMVAIAAPHWALFRDLSDQAFASTWRELAHWWTCRNIRSILAVPRKSRQSERPIRTATASRLPSFLHKDGHGERAGITAQSPPANTWGRV